MIKSAPPNENDYHSHLEFWSKKEGLKSPFLFWFYGWITVAPSSAIASKLL